METLVGVLAIGNEVVEGQITNRNAAWLSTQLSKLGAQTLYHLSCRDERDEILNSMNFLGQHCNFILVCGGLGPTKDDTTREALSEWSSAPLAHDETQWLVIKEKLQGRRVTLREGHKRQALVPKGAVALGNSKGVAPGFFMKTPKGFLASLPGPPYELQAMFNEHLAPLIVDQIKPQPDKELKTWICLGAPESEIAHITESLLGDDFSFGFRLHKPYVEVKVWLPISPPATASVRLARLEEKLGPWLVGKSIEDIRFRFHDHLKKFDHVFVIDHLTSGLFLEKLKEDFHSDHLRYQCFEHKSFRYFSQHEVQGILSHVGLDSSKNNLFISLFAASEHSAHLSFNDEIQTIEIPSRFPVTSMIGQLYVIEKCFLQVQRG